DWLGPSSRPVGGVQADGQSSVWGPRGANRVEDLQGEAQARLQGPAVFVRSCVGERRDEARQQITVSEVQQDQIEAGLSRQPRRSNERLSHAWHVVVAHRRGDNRPATLAERTI